MKLATLSQLKNHLGIPQADVSKDAILNMLLLGSSKTVESMTSRKFALQSHEIKLSGDGSKQLILPQYPILVVDDIPSVQVILNGVSLTLDNLDVDAEAGIIYRKNGAWSNGHRNIDITFSAGYKTPTNEDSGTEDATTVPEDLQMVVIRLAARIYERRTAEGVASASPSSYSVTYKDKIDDDIMDVIGSYTRMRIS